MRYTSATAILVSATASTTLAVTTDAHFTRRQSSRVLQDDIMPLSMILSDTGNPFLSYGDLTSEGGGDDNATTSPSVVDGSGSVTTTTTTTTTKASKATKARKLQDLSTLSTWDKEPIIDGFDMAMSVPGMSMPPPMQVSSGIDEPTSPPVSDVISFEDVVYDPEAESAETVTEMSMSMSHSMSSMSTSMSVSEIETDTKTDVEKYTNPNNIVTVAVPLDGPYHLLHKEEEILTLEPTEYPTPAPVEALVYKDEPTPAPVTDEPTLKPTTGGEEEEEISAIEPSADVEEEHDGGWISASALNAKAAKQAKNRKFRNRRFLQMEDLSLSMSLSLSVPLDPLVFSMSMSIPEDPLSFVKDPLVEENLTLDSIHCTWRAWFAKKPKSACGILNDGNHTVPYTCDGEYPNVCCTESTITDPMLNLFGTCYKNVDDMASPSAAPTEMTTEAIAEATVEPTAAPTDEPTTAPTEDPTTLAPVTNEPTTLAPVTGEPTTLAPVTGEPTSLAPVTEEPTEVPTAAPVPAPEPTDEPTAAPVESSGPSTIHCRWRPSFQEMSITKICEDNVKFPVPYACDADNGYKVCCSVSSITSPFDLGKYGNCYKATGSS